MTGPVVTPGMTRDPIHLAAPGGGVLCGAEASTDGVFYVHYLPHMWDRLYPEAQCPGCREWRHA